MGAMVFACKGPGTDKDIHTASGLGSAPDLILRGNAFGSSFSIKIFYPQKEEKASPSVRRADFNSLKKRNPEANSDGLERLSIQKLVESKLLEVESVFSNWKENSEISRFNRHRSKLPFRVSSAFLTVIKNAQKIYHLSQGAFDPAHAELFSLWEQKNLSLRDKEKKPALPSSSEVQKFWKRGGMRFLRILENSGQIKKLHPRVTLNLSGIAKGYGVDQIAELLYQKGFPSFMVEIGGEVRVGHRKAKGALWRIGIEKPTYNKDIRGGKEAFSMRPEQKQLQVRRKLYKLAVLEKGALASSGDYRNYFIGHSGKLYSHILDPRKAYPIKTSIAAVTVIGPSCMLADALATSLMVLDLEKGLGMIEKLPKYEALWILSSDRENYTHRLSSGMSSYIE